MLSMLTEPTPSTNPDTVKSHLLGQCTIVINRLENGFIRAIRRQKRSQSTKDSCAFFLVWHKSPHFQGAKQF